MKNQFVTYQIALKLKELGFNEEFTTFDSTFYYINGGIGRCNDEYRRIFLEKEYVLAPLWQQVIEWFRENNGIHISIDLDTLEEQSNFEDIMTYCYHINKFWRSGEDYTDYDKFGSTYLHGERKFKNYISCVESAILKAIELIK